jgi:hypothetical protein
VARGRHRKTSPRRTVQPVLGLAVAATVLGVPFLVAALPGGATDPDVPAPPTVAAGTIEFSALAARDRAQASRGEARSAPSASAAAEPSVAEASEPSGTAEAEPSAETVPSEPPAVVDRRWATQAVNVRSGPTVDSERVGHLGALVEVGVTGEISGDWVQVVVDDQAGWVNGAYLSDTEPTAQEAAAASTSDAPCSIDSHIEPNLSAGARAVYRAVCAAYGGSVSGFGGYRPGDDGDHGSGRAVDVMVSGAAGWEIAGYLQPRADELGITYIIYEQRIWEAGTPAGAWQWMADRGGATANHYDHVHISVR